ncbi:hypothetical protein HJC23_008575 [Cyclotella cryptica]|uniref:Uncharacterized protein n=1 Tax=Cyclotella cryptica TaxID=29204 RepID=A0ABD3Q7V9_9STRA|eukprot:CCRYP_007929-RA/>CCRYP_007929-RA protein AED:0.31 eAED:0.31 QI:0/-1/0/1/-1/1/1/0/471
MNTGPSSKESIYQDSSDEDYSDFLLPNTCISISPYHHHDAQLRFATLRQKKHELKAVEKRAREIAKHSVPTLFVVNLCSAALVFLKMLLNPESMLGLVLTVGATLIAYYAVLSKEEAQGTSMEYDWNGNIPTVLLSFAIITPISSSITMAFTRRENALRSLAAFRSAVYNLYVAHASWDWGQCHKGQGRKGCFENEEDMAAVYGKDYKNGEGKKKIDFMQHSETTLRQLIHLSDGLYQYLTLPTATLAKHRFTSWGRNKSKQILSCGRSLFTLNVNGRMTMISQLCEALKYRGLPGAEAARMRQWENFITTAMEELRIVKKYRTPQALRSFGRLFTMFLPAFYAPSYVQVARDTDSLAMGVAVGVVTSIALTALFECVRQLEDPFVSHVTLDAIDVREELVVLVYQELMTAREVLFPEAESFELNSDEFTRGSLHIRKDIEESNKCGRRGSDEHRESTVSDELDRTSRHKH